MHIVILASILKLQEVVPSLCQYREITFVMNDKSPFMHSLLNLWLDNVLVWF